MKTINERVYFYLNLFMADPNSKAQPLMNLNGLLKNVLKYTEQQRELFIYHTHNLGEENERQQHTKANSSKV